jgi:hypothetical protein
MIKRYNRLSILCGITGIAALIAGFAMVMEAPNLRRAPDFFVFHGAAFLIVGTTLACAGFGYYAKAKGHDFERGFFCKGGPFGLVDLEDRSGDPWPAEGKVPRSLTFKRHVEQLVESRQHEGDGQVVCIGDSIGGRDVYWSRADSCWIVVDHRSDRAKIWRTPEIALVRLTADAHLADYGAEEVALASDGEDGDSVYILPADKVNLLTGAGPGIEVLWRSDRSSKV